jgi:transcriptional regulator with XRE-family HTH domain
MGDESPGEMIRRGRHEAGLSQAELAAQLRVHKGTVGDWERDKYFPERHYGLLNKLLGVTLRPPGAAAEPDIPPDVLAVIRKNYTPEQQREAIEMLGQLGPSGSPEGEPSQGDGSERAG